MKTTGPCVFQDRCLKSLVPLFRSHSVIDDVLFVGSVGKLDSAVVKLCDFSPELGDLDFQILQVIAIDH